MIQPSLNLSIGACLALALFSCTGDWLIVVFGGFHHEELTSLAVGDTHQIAIKSEDGWKQETGSIWIMSREASVSFLAGENGRLQYRAYCILDCIGMEHLTNLLIQVV